MNSVNKEIIEEFIKLGFTKYEAMAYLTILREGESYGSEISKKSGIPGAKVYETLDRLVEKGLAYPTSGSPQLYQALPLKDFLDNKKKEFDRTINFFEKIENDIDKIKSVEMLWYLTGRDSLIDKARDYIDSTEKEIFISLWPEEANELRDNLEKAAKRGVRIVSLQFNDHYLDLGKVYHHVKLPTVRDRHGSEMFLLVDDAKGMFMFMEEHYGWKGFYTSSKGICRVIKNYITHDIYTNKMLMDHSEAMFKFYGDKLQDLLDI